VDDEGILKKTNSSDFSVKEIMFVEFIESVELKGNKPSNYYVQNLRSF
jgi:hypothetical protein